MSEPLLQVTEALDSPDLADHARDVRAQSTKLESENGPAQHHYVRIDRLKPDTLYAYRVRGRDTWSEWIHHRTAAATARPFAFLYLGDAQNSIKGLYSRVLREAWRREPQAALALYAGDLINGRDDENNIEWGEWFDAGGFIYSSMLVVPAPGNHAVLSGEVLRDMCSDRELQVRGQFHSARDSTSPSLLIRRVAAPPRRRALLLDNVDEPSHRRHWY